MTNRQLSMIIFFTIVFTLYALVCLYLYKRSIQALPETGYIRKIFPYIFVFLSLSYLFYRILQGYHVSMVSIFFGWVGSFWLGAVVFFLIFALFFDLLRFINHIIPYYPAWISDNYAYTKLWLFRGTVTIVLLLLAGGFINARMPRLKEVKVVIDKKAGNREKLTAVLLSDIHLSSLTTPSFVKRIVRKTMAQEPDIIFLTGDVFDDDIRPVLKNRTAAMLSEISAPLGVYAIMGNHEYIGGEAKAAAYLDELGFSLLRDTLVKIDNSFYIAGREDITKGRFTQYNRKELELLLREIDPAYPVILLDHQPNDLAKAASLDVDMQLSGHTHHGQFWPINYITSAMFDVSRGYANINGMHVFVTNGVGTWGPPIRIGNTPEIVKLNIYFNAK